MNTYEVFCKEQGISLFELMTKDCYENVRSNLKEEHDRRLKEPTKASLRRVKLDGTKLIAEFFLEPCYRLPEGELTEACLNGLLLKHTSVKRRYVPAHIATYVGEHYTLYSPEEVKKALEACPLEPFLMDPRKPLPDDPLIKWIKSADIR